MSVHSGSLSYFRSYVFTPNLNHFDITRGKVAQLVVRTPDVLSYEPLEDEVAAAVLGLSMHGGADNEPPYPHRDFELIVTPIREVGDRLDEIYGLPFREEGGEIRFRDPALLPSSDAYEESRSDVQLLLKAMGLSRTELDAVINSKFVCFGAHPGEDEIGLDIRIISEKRDSIESIQPDIERIHGLTVEALDHIHRFVRLWRATPWSIGELDLLIVELDHREYCSGLEADTLQRLAELFQIQSRFDITVEELVSLWSWLPCITVDGAERSFFDRLFEGSDFICNDWHEDASSLEPFLHPALRITPPGEPDEVLPGLLAGLKVDDATLYALIVHLAVPLGIEDLEAPDESNRTFALHRGNLSLIYRHARLAEWLGLSVSELFQLTELAGLSADTQVSDLGSLGTLLAFQTWWKSTNWSLDDLAFMTGGTLIHSANYPDAGATCERMMQKLRESQPLLFGTSLFSYLEGVTEAQSRDIILANTHAFVAVPGLRYRLSEAFDSETMPTAIQIPQIPDGPILATQDELFTLLVAYLTPGDSGKPSIPVFDDTLFAKLPNVTQSQSRAIVAENGRLIVPVPLEDVYWLAEDFDPGTSLSIPEGIPVTDEDSKELIARYHVSEVIPSLLSAELGMPAQKIKAMITLTGMNLADAQFVSALQTNGPKDSLIALVATLLRLRVLFKDTCFETDVLDFVDDQAALFEATDFVNLSTQTVRLVALYAEIVQAGENSAVHRSALHNRLRHYTGERFYPESGDNFAQAELAIVLGIEVGLAITAQEELDLPENALEAMVKLMRCVELAGLLGVGGEILPRMVANDYPTLDRAATALRSAIRTKYTDDGQWRDKIEPFDDRQRTLRRNALTDYLLHSISPRLFSSHNDLYHHFLIDVELDGCARTSRIVAANSSLQLYVHRALMNLEQDRAEIIEIELDDEAVDEWEWRKNYRVWEANRKVFLYPENYIEPDLRDNKTPLFEELEATLLQQEINEDSVLEAYSSYMRGFDEVAHLSIAGSYHDLHAGPADHDVLHLFGVSQGDSFSYYYRTVNNLFHSELDETRDMRGVVWNPWRKIDVQIPVRKASPIVFNGRLYVFWVEIISRPMNEIENGSSAFVGYQHKMTLKFTKLLLDGSWSSPQKILLNDRNTFELGDGKIIDKFWDGKFSLVENEVGDVVTAVIPKYGKGSLVEKEVEILLAEIEVGDEVNNEVGDEVNTVIPKYSSSDTDWHLDQVGQFDKEIRLRHGIASYRVTGGGSLFLSLEELMESCDLKFESKDDYSLGGFQWERVYPYLNHYENAIVVTGRNFRMRSRIDFYRSAIRHQEVSGNDGISGRILGWKRDGDDSGLFCGLPPNALRGWLNPYAFASVLIDQRNADYWGSRDFALWGTDFYHGAGPGAWGENENDLMSRCLYYYPVAKNLDAEAEISAINGSVNDGILDTKGDLLYFQASPASISDYSVRRIGTTVSDEAASILFAGGVDALLSLETQETLAEASLPVDLEADCVAINMANAGKLDFEGPFGVYYREIFFHIPFLIANHLNSSQKFAEAQKWYHHIFNPMAKATGTEDEPTDRNWRYVEFRDINDPMSLAGAIDAPHGNRDLQAEIRSIPTPLPGFD